MAARRPARRPWGLCDGELIAYDFVLLYRLCGNKDCTFALSVEPKTAAVPTAPLWKLALKHVSHFALPTSLLPPTVARAPPPSLRRLSAPNPTPYRHQPSTCARMSADASSFAVTG